MSTVAWIFSIIGMVGAAGLVVFVLWVLLLLGIAAYKGLMS